MMMAFTILGNLKTLEWIFLIFVGVLGGFFSHSRKYSKRKRWKKFLNDHKGGLKIIHQKTLPELVEKIYPHIQKLNFSKEGMNLIEICYNLNQTDEILESDFNKAYENLFDYYYYTPLELASQFVSKKSKFSTDKIKRMVYEGGFQERHFLENFLPLNHFLLQEFNDKCRIPISDELDILI
jgi:hypothetical protein